MCPWPSFELKSKLEVNLLIQHLFDVWSRMKSPIVRLRLVTSLSLSFVQRGATDGKVTVAQTLVRRTQWNFNTIVMADGMRTLLDVVTNECAAPEV